jgi:galactoside O-acetyltransferase
VLPAVRIGYGSVVGAGSVVSRDIPPMVVAVGVPARVLRPITDDDLTTRTVVAE